MNSNCNNCNPNIALGSTLRQLGISPLARINAALALRGEKVGELAKHLQRSKAHIYEVIRGTRDSEPLRHAIAGNLRVAVEDIWGQRQDNDELFSLANHNLATGGGAPQIPSNNLAETDER